MGGHTVRNMVSAETDLPATFTRGRRHGDAIDVAAAKNVRWAARLGMNAYGNPTVACGRVFVGTDGNSIDDDPRFNANHVGVVKCLAVSDGSLIWPSL